MLKRTLKDAASRIAPAPVLARYHHLKLINQARRLRALSRQTNDPGVWIDYLFGSHFFRPLQKKTEILRLLELVKALRPAAICEIGAAGGGTTFLFAQLARPDAILITVDLMLTPSRQSAINRFALLGQRIISVPCDSHLQETLGTVNDCLQGHSLDVLFIDGDHSYEGVSADFKLYSPLVRSGGIIVFHDIVPDHKTRFGIKTSSDVGGVPQFWQEIKSSHPDVEEIVEDYDQDGFGIGVLHWTVSLTKS